MKKFTLLFSVLCSMFIAATAQVNKTVVYDFTNGAFNIPTFIENKGAVSKKTVFTDGTNTITFVPGAFMGSIYYEEAGYIRLQNRKAKLLLPAFDFAVEKIVVVGHPAGTSYPNVDMNVYVGNKAVSTANIGTTETYTYEIAEEYQEAGNEFGLVIGTNGGEYSSIMFISKILVYPKASEDALTVQAPEFDKAAGVYTEPITVTAYSQTANVEGVSNVIYYYTTNGYEPDEECDETKDGKIEIESSCTLKVVVSFEYNGETYTSESTTAEYIISEPVKAKVANEITPGSYFIAADGNIATMFDNNSLPVKQAMEAGDGTVTDADYYLYTIEEITYKEETNLYMRDALGQYIRIDGMNGKLQTSTTFHNCQMSFSVIGDIVRITNGTHYLVFDKENNCFKVTDTISDTTVFPTLYRLADETTAIDGVKGENSIEAIYDLTGRKIDNITKPGIYIVNGNKVLVK